MHSSYQSNGRFSLTAALPREPLNFILISTYFQGDFPNFFDASWVPARIFGSIFESLPGNLPQNTPFRSWKYWI
jgi:hypothetical protein